jgi:hypothetical protein
MLYFRNYDHAAVVCLLARFGAGNSIVKSEVNVCEKRATLVFKLLGALRGFPPQKGVRLRPARNTIIE